MYVKILQEESYDGATILTKIWQLSQTLMHVSVVNQGRSADLTLQKQFWQTETLMIRCSELRDAMADKSGSHAKARIRYDFVLFRWICLGKGR